MVVLVVAADDGVMPQTIEAIQHARAAGVPIVVAVNKIDKPDADPERVRTELSKHEVIPEEWGGQNMFVQRLGAHRRRASTSCSRRSCCRPRCWSSRRRAAVWPSAVVVESSIEKGRGAVATVLVKRGTLKLRRSHPGRHRVRPRARHVRRGRQAGRARPLPSMPVVVLGLSGAPNAGDELLVVESERKAREVALHRQGKFRDVKLAQAGRRAPRTCSRRWARPRPASVAVLIKTDVQGSAEALRDALNKLSTDEVQVQVHRQRRRRHHRLRRAAGGGLQGRASSASTCAPTPARARR